MLVMLCFASMDFGWISRCIAWLEAMVAGDGQTRKFEKFEIGPDSKTRKANWHYDTTFLFRIIVIGTTILKEDTEESELYRPIFFHDFINVLWKKNLDHNNRRRRKNVVFSRGPKAKTACKPQTAQELANTGQLGCPRSIIFGCIRLYFSSLGCGKHLRDAFASSSWLRKVT